LSKRAIAVLLLVCLQAGMAQVQAPPPADAQASTAKPVRTKDRRRAAELYLNGGKLFEKGRIDEAWQKYQQAAALDPDNATYTGAAAVAKSHLVTQLIQQAARNRIMGRQVDALSALVHARDLDPHSPLVTQHLYELAADAAPDEEKSLYAESGSKLGPAPQLEPTLEKKSFHLRTNAQQVIQQVYQGYGIQATVDQGVTGQIVRFDLDNVTYDQATQALALVTDTFAVALDAHRALVAKDTQENRNKFERLEVETVYLSGLTQAEIVDVSNLAKNIFGAKQVAISQSAGTITVRAPHDTLVALNNTLRNLLDGRSQVMLNVRLIQIANTKGRTTGAILPQQLTAFNVYAEEQSILNANQSLVEEIISSGLASADDPLAIIGILIASGQVSSSLFESGIALFGGGITLSGLSPGPGTLNLTLNSSESRALDQIQLRLTDGEDGTIRSGFRYPITTSSYSSLGTSDTSIAGLTTAGTSSALSSLLSSLTSSAISAPQIQYQDLGLTLKALPRVMRNGNVALTLDFKITALSGSSINDLPVMNNRSYSGVVQVKEGAGVVVVSQLSKQESRALSGTPGLSEIPGMSELTGKDTAQDYATLLIIITPQVIRGTQAAGHSAMMRIERGTP
jgi:general secretion pathway protein D